ncbi:hypothetical protein AB1L88_08350 [Tautonia sp. JC769]|uniref:hypothetical protein n=1 Tax=Tautonia sp. JC769 TaxID=3232135 RepID=UPI00345B3F0C
MSNGWPSVRRRGRGVLPKTAAVALMGMALVLAGCAQGQKRPGFFEKNAGKPLFPKASTPRPEPGLRVQAPGVDVAITDSTREEMKVAQSGPLTDRASRMSLFRSDSSSRSLEGARPLD